METVKHLSLEFRWTVWIFFWLEVRSLSARGQLSKVFPCRNAEAIWTWYMMCSSSFVSIRLQKSLASCSLGLAGEKSPVQQSQCFTLWELEGHPSNWLAESWGKIMTETKISKWKLLPCMTVGSECFLTQLHVNIPLSFPNEVSEIRDNFFHCWLLITIFIEDAVQSLIVVLCLHTRCLQNVFSLQEENVQCKNVSAAMETIRLSESSEFFSGKLFVCGFFFNSPHEILDSF